MIATTSREAYHTIYDKLGDRQKKVFDALGQLGVASNDQLADYLQIPLSSVCGRINELCKYGVVGAEGKKQGKYGHMVTTWSVRIPREYQQARLL